MYWTVPAYVGCPTSIWYVNVHTDLTPRRTKVDSRYKSSKAQHFSGHGDKDMVTSKAIPIPVASQRGSSKDTT